MRKNTGVPRSGDIPYTGLTGVASTQQVCAMGSVIAVAKRYGLVLTVRWRYKYIYLYVLHPLRALKA